MQAVPLGADSAGGKTAQSPQDQRQCAEQRQAILKLQSAEDADLQQHVAWALQHLPNVPLGTTAQHHLRKLVYNASTIVSCPLLHAQETAAMFTQQCLHSTVCMHSSKSVQLANPCWCDTELVKGLAGREQINAYGIMAPSGAEVSISFIPPASLFIIQ